MKRYNDPPLTRFLCLIVYKTPGGATREYSCVTEAFAADLALTIADKRLANDKRRVVASVLYSEAIER